MGFGGGSANVVSVLPCIRFHVKEFGPIVPSDGVVEFSSEHATVPRRSWRDGYLLFPVREDEAFDLLLYYVGRLQRGLTVQPLNDSEWSITAIYHGSGPFTQLQRTAEGVGIGRPEVGTLTGWTDANRVEDAARQLVILRAGADRRVRRCRSRVQPVGTAVKRRWWGP